MIWGGADVIIVEIKVKVTQSCPTLCDPMDGILQARILEWVASSLLQGIFPTQGSNPGLPHFRWILSKLRHQETQIIMKMKCTIDVMLLNHHKTIPLHLNHGKIIFHETGPWCQKRLGAAALEDCYREVTNIVSQVTWIQIQTLHFFPVLPWESHLIFPTFSPLVCKMQGLTVLSLMVWWGLNEIRGVKSLAQCPAHRKHCDVSCHDYLHAFSHLTFTTIPWVGCYCPLFIDQTDLRLWGSINCLRSQKGSSGAGSARRETLSFFVLFTFQTSWWMVPGLRQHDSYF